MINIAFCDDNEIQREILGLMLEKYSGIHPGISYKAFESGESLLAEIKAGNSYDIYILDIIMPGINGMEIASTLRLMNDKGLIIFTTATVDYAVMSYDVQAFYYMIKPIDPDKFEKILNNAVDQLDARDNTILVKTINGDFRLKTKDIMYIEIKDRAPCYNMNNGLVCEGTKLRGSFKEAVSGLRSDPSFIECGVSRLVNLRYIDAIDSESILLHNGTQLFIPKSAYTDVKKLWKEFKK